MSHETAEYDDCGCSCIGNPTSHKSFMCSDTGSTCAVPELSHELMGLPGVKLTGEAATNMLSVVAVLVAVYVIGY